MGYGETMALRDDALRLAELDLQVVQIFVDGHMEVFGNALAEYLTLKANLKQQMLDESTISIEDPEALEILRKIGRNGTFRSDEIVERIKDHTGGDLAVEEVDGVDLERLRSDLFHSWYSAEEYVSALRELRPLILGCDTSKSVIRLVEQIKRCNAFQQYDAAFGLCRTLLEASIRDICVRRGLFPDREESAVLYDYIKSSVLRDRVSSGHLKETLRELFDRLSKVLHAQRTVGPVEARRAFGDTLLAIEKLYESHNL